MPAVTANTLELPCLPDVDRRASVDRFPDRIVTARTTLEGEGFQVRRSFPGVDLQLADPFLLLDHLGAVDYGPGEAKGAPDHPHRGFETVTYVMDGAIEHKDSTGGGGLIHDGATQWMTAGAGIVHSEMPPEELVVSGGLFHAVQLWVNLPAAEKWSPPRYQDIPGESVDLVASADGGALVRLIAGDLAGYRGPGMTRTPITYAHATVSAGARMEVPWRPDFNALVYVLSGRGRIGADGVPVTEGQLAVLGPGDHITVQADDRQPIGLTAMDVLLVGGRPIGEPVVFYGPFVMNTRAEILQAVEDYQSGRMGSIPATRA
jgi:redox-sensitive bicupin YhaK (pirin superfamily)